MFLIVINIVCNNVTIYFKDKIELHCKSYCVMIARIMTEVWLVRFVVKFVNKEPFPHIKSEQYFGVGCPMQYKYKSNLILAIIRMILSEIFILVGRG